MNEEALYELESRIAHQDQSIDQLSDIVRQQWDTIDQLRREIRLLEQRMSELEQSDGPAPNVPPPHY